MTTTEQRLADALRAVVDAANAPDARHGARSNGHCGVDRDDFIQHTEIEDETLNVARKALAAYDAQASSLPTEYRVTTEWDAFEALTPSEAASEVWEKIKRSEGPIFTVYGRDGSVTDVDLSEDDSNA